MAKEAVDFFSLVLGISSRSCEEKHSDLVVFFCEMKSRRPYDGKDGGSRNLIHYEPTDDFIKIRLYSLYYRQMLPLYGQLRQLQQQQQHLQQLFVDKLYDDNQHQ